MQWIAYYRLHPWGDDWEQMGMLMAIVANIFSKEPIDADDFIPFRNREGHSAEYRRRKELLDKLKKKRQQEEEQRKKREEEKKKNERRQKILRKGMVKSGNTVRFDK